MNNRPNDLLPSAITCAECGHTFAGRNLARGLNHYDTCKSTLARGKDYAAEYRRKHEGEDAPRNYVTGVLGPEDSFRRKGGTGAFGRTT